MLLGDIRSERCIELLLRYMMQFSYISHLVVLKWVALLVTQSYVVSVRHELDVEDEALLRSHYSSSILVFQILPLPISRLMV